MVQIIVLAAVAFFFFGTQVSIRSRQGFETQSNINNKTNSQTKIAKVRKTMTS